MTPPTTAAASCGAEKPGDEAEDSGVLVGVTVWPAAVLPAAPPVPVVMRVAEVTVVNEAVVVASVDPVGVGMPDEATGVTSTARQLS